MLLQLLGHLQIVHTCVRHCAEHAEDAAQTLKCSLQMSERTNASLPDTLTNLQCQTVNCHNWWTVAKVCVCETDWTLFTSDRPRLLIRCEVTDTHTLIGSGCESKRCCLVLNETSLLSSCYYVILTGAVICVCVCMCTSCPQLLVANALLFLNYVI